ncbi:hypothetical protein HHI36_006271 [Cryptolaemus montrouzieri]|uniref:Lipase domain-containing protein n=1 Tax=Cryptolaemus montrouzieri TaxID=559131 RepID=A0ABD2NY06_9CUCU
MAAAKYVGNIIGNLMISIHEKRHISTKNMILLPHSLGSHVSGYAAKTVKQVLPRIARIIAMDPAGPRWVNKPCDKRLCKTDADVVEVLHTDVGGLGYEAPLGTIDFYANGGSNQSGCDSPEASKEFACSHCRSWAYVIEAIKHPNHFISENCNDWKTYQEKKKRCGNMSIALGDLEAKEGGVYYFKTHNKSPFAMENGEEEDSSGLASITRSSGLLIFISLVLLKIKSINIKQTL